MEQVEKSSGQVERAALSGNLNSLKGNLISLLPKNPHFSTQHSEINNLIIFFVLSKVNSNMFPCSETFWGKALPIRSTAF